MVDSVEAIQAPKPGEAISSAPTRENPREVNPGSEESVLKVRVELILLIFSLCYMI